MVEKQNIHSSKKILLHACCAICSAYPISLLKDMGYSVVVYFYNPNIYPVEEYEKRLDAQRTLCAHFGCELIVGEYEPEIYYESVKGYENEPEKGARCDKCFELRLKKSAEMAKTLGIEEFTTSIVISPHKNYEKLTAIGQSIAQDFDLNYLAENLHKTLTILKNYDKIYKDFANAMCNYKF